MALLRTMELWRRIRDGERFLADGAMGTELIRQGVPPASVLHANRSHASEVRDIHTAYVEAGAKILTTNTFGAAPSLPLREDFRAGISNALTVAGSRKEQTALWISVTSETLLQQSELHHLIANAYPSTAILIETCTDLRLAVDAVRCARTLMPDMLAVTCHFEEDGELADGSTIEKVVIALEKAGADIIGANCGNTSEVILLVAQCMRAMTKTPLLFQPGAGIPQDDGDGTWVYPLTPEGFADVALQLYEAGVAIVGGCCGTTPAHIEAAYQRCAHLFRR